MPKLIKNIEADEMKLAEYDMEMTLGNVQFLMSQMTDPESFRLTRVKVPSSDGRAFVIPNGTDEPELTTSIEGLIMYHHRVNAYWAKEYGKGPPEPPVCESMDGISGFDMDGMETLCRYCPRNRLGTAIKGRGKACKNMRRLLILREGDASPLEMYLPPTSIANFGAYVSQLAPRRLRPQDVITRIKLSVSTNSGGVEYSQALFAMTGTVDRRQAERLRMAMGFLLTTAGTQEPPALTESTDSTETPDNGYEDRLINAELSASA